MSDNRADLTKVNARTLILQCSEDIIAGQQVGAYVQRNIPNSKMAVLKATGHCPNRTGEAGCLAGHGGFRKGRVARFCRPYLINRGSRFLGAFAPSSASL
jgi:pimeloyl-ACP methyl ester carboxylesterase